MKEREFMGLPQTVGFDELTNELLIIDQTLLPVRLEILRISEVNDLCDAIKKLKVRGAPAIGVAAAIGLYAVACRFEEVREEGFFYALEKHAQRINATRPTAKNLSWALERMCECAKSHRGQGIDKILSAMKAEAVAVRDEDIRTCRLIGEYGESLLSDGDTVMTVCNAGALAAVEYGTALSPVYTAKEKGKEIKVYSLETRPLLQGARLTSFELTENGVDTTLICDNMAATVLKSGKIKAIFTGADRVTARGDAANKIGTLMLAILAKHYGVPFYVCVPYSTVDFSLDDGDEIVIEERDGEEIKSAWYRETLVSPKVKVYNPAFDVTPAELITAFVTEKGIKKPSELQ